MTHEEIEKILNEDLEIICDRFVDNKLSIHFRDDKIKSILLQVIKGLKVFVN